MDRPLSKQEKVVLQMSWGGLQAKEIARAMGISEGSVRYYKTKIHMKLRVSNSMQLARYAVEHGLVALNKVRS